MANFSWIHLYFRSSLWIQTAIYLARSK